MPPLSANPPTALALGILPHILLPLVLALAYFPPPFPGRALLVLVLAALLQWRCAVSPWPPNTGDTRALRYGLACTWLFVLPAVERLVLHTPEREFWRVDNPPGHPSDARTVPALEGKRSGSSPREWSWAKMWWGVRLFVTPRAVGWNFGSRAINAQRVGILETRRRGEVTRVGFVLGCLVRAFWCYLVWDGVMLAERKLVIPEGWAWDRDVVGRILFSELLMVLVTYCGMTMQFNLGAAIGVATGLNGPEEWPPLFGSVVDCYTINNVWGNFWHQYIRQPCLGFSHYIVNVLRIPRRSSLAYLIHLTTAFAISTFFHILSVGAVAPGYYPLANLISDMSIFFMLQPIATMVEVAVMKLFSRYVLAPQPVQADSKTERKPNEQQMAGLADGHAESVVSGGVEGTGETTPTGKAAILRSIGAALCRLVGYVWVFSWFSFSGWWFVKGYAGVRMQDWQVPFSIVGKLVVPGY
ncbi:membrane bound O-acyl transferase family-domain-containing protein [Lasiosphaeria hispida]|uniref:Membrane bound O-acyl transferase family-domain-containing protein n=1 Tax=Lasiosphaeria hispida TaxID=260671 RepID=A0AAJ0MGQ0_9PEZI|nr:membrane bound O-acyl transferase family-domain-containing protein [Lasiosphaeria hispida]